jgi:hypothetical protein
VTSWLQFFKNLMDKGDRDRSFSNSGRDALILPSRILPTVASRLTGSIRSFETRLEL